MSTPLQKNLRHRLEENNISANALERKAGLKPSAVQNILQGKSKRPAAELLIAISNELGCAVEDLLSEKKDSRDQKGVKEWIPTLYVNSLRVVQLELERMKVNLEKQEVLALADEVYTYSVRGSTQFADKRFATWLVSKKVNHS